MATDLSMGYAVISVVGVVFGGTWYTHSGTSRNGGDFTDAVAAAQRIA